MAETTNLTVIIAGRSYPLKVEKAEEQKVLQTVKTINERITLLQAQFQSKDKQDCLAMALLELSLGQNGGTTTEKQDLNSLKQSLRQLEQSIDQLLS
jgi:cell division protein ZapA (FtsZ GTPase activity inhibitor)